MILFHVSDRGIELVTQDVSLFPMLTVENYSKWNNLYLLLPNGKVHIINPWDVTDDCEWFGHCISPKGFDRVANTLMVRYDQKTMDKVVEVFKENHLDSADNSDVEIPEEYRADCPWWQKDVEGRVYLSPRSGPREQWEMDQFSKTLDVEGHFHNFLEHMSAYYLEEELVQRYDEDLKSALSFARMTGMPQVVQGEAPGFFLVHGNNIAAWCISMRHFDLMTEGEFKVKEARDRWNKGEITVQEFHQIRKENLPSKLVKSDSFGEVR